VVLLALLLALLQWECRQEEEEGPEAHHHH